MDFLDELQQHVLPGDGAMGTLLMARGFSLEQCLEELSVSAPEAVRQVHEEHMAAGARLIRTNTFGANAVRLARHGIERRVSEINWSAAQLARDCARGKGIFVAGSVGPLGISALQARERGVDRQAVFTEQLGALLDGGVQVIFFETFLDVEELLLALEAKQALHHLPVICSMACDAQGQLPDGTPVARALDRLRVAEAEVVGINCTDGPDAMARIFEMIEVTGPMSAFPNAGAPPATATPEEFARTAVRLARRGAGLIGGCCGTTPAHVAAMVEALRDVAG